MTDGRITNGAFLTISVNGMNKTGFAPGDTDPDVAGHLSSYTVYLSMLFAEKRVCLLFISPNGGFDLASPMSVFKPLLQEVS